MIKYVDDILLYCPENLTSETLEIFNSVNNHVKFTMEVESENKIAYLDQLLVRQDNGSIETEFFMKPQSSGRILNFHSHHSMKLKINTAVGLIRRVFEFTSNKTREEKSDVVRSILLKNSYPRRIINKLINEYQSKSPSTTVRQDRLIAPVSIQYVKGLTEAICKKITSLNGNKTIGVSSQRSLMRFFSKLKDPLDDEEKTRLIYYIPCKDCLKAYIGLIWRQFITKRKKQHIYGQNNARTKKNRTALEDHVVNEGHRFDFDNMRILDMNSNYGKLKILEMLHINANNTVNKRSDVSNTIHQYSGLLHHLKLKNFI
jgi:hypothetical protein